MAVTPYTFYPHSICFALPSLLLLYLLFHECEWLAIISEYEPRKWKTLRIFKKYLMRVQTLLLDIGFTYFEILNHLIEFWSPLAGNFISKLIQKCFRCFKHRLWNTYFSEHVFSLPSFFFSEHILYLFAYFSWSKNDVSVLSQRIWDQLFNWTNVFKNTFTWYYQINMFLRPPFSKFIW